MGEKSLAIKEKLAKILDGDDSLIGRIVTGCLITLICLNIISVILESVLTFRQLYGTFFFAFEAFSVVIFTLEYSLRLWLAPQSQAKISSFVSTLSLEKKGKKPSDIKQRLIYIISPMALVDLLAILPFYIGFLFPGLDLRFLRALRLLRILKLARYSQSISLMLNVLVEERKSLMAAITILLIMMVIGACGIYVFENRAQPDAFTSIPASMYWAMVTLTTVGYGDMAPITPGGKIFAALITIVGVGMVALPAGILASSFSDALKRRQEEFAEEVEDALDDGVITDDENTILERLRENLVLSEDMSAAMIRGAQRKKAPQLFSQPYQQQANCPHCGKEITRKDIK